MRPENDDMTNKLVSFYADIVTCLLVDSVGAIFHPPHKRIIPAMVYKLVGMNKARLDQGGMANRAGLDSAGERNRVSNMIRKTG